MPTISPGLLLLLGPTPPLVGLEYRVYANDGAGGPVDYSAPLASVAGLTWSSSPLAFSSDWKFAVRTYDGDSGLEESNVDTLVRVTVDAGGADVSGVPNAPSSVSALATAGGTARIDWNYNAGGRATPTGFKIWATVGGTVNYAVAPSATVLYASGRLSGTLSGLTDGVAYAIGVRAYNATGTEPNTTAVASVTGATSPPSVVDDLGAVVVASP